MREHALARWYQDSPVCRMLVASAICWTLQRGRPRCAAYIYMRLPLASPLTIQRSATLTTFKQLSSLKLSRFALGNSMLLRQLNVKPSHALAALTELEFASCGIGARTSLGLMLTPVQHLGVHVNEAALVCAFKDFQTAAL